MTQQPSIQKESAPPPDHPAKPKTPPRVKKDTWKYVLKRTVHEFIDDHCTDIAASLTYYGILAMFPALLALVAVLGLVGNADQTTGALLDAVGAVAPGTAVDLLREPIQELVNSPAAGLALVAGILGALWSASAYVGAFSRAMNRVYEIDEGRPFWKLRPALLLMTLVAIVIIAVMALILAVSGTAASAVGELLGLGEVAIAVWTVVKWPILVALAVVIVAILYYLTPNVKQPKFRWMSLGALIALVVLAAASTGFAFYVGNFAHYNKTYGAIGGVIVLLLWVWLVNLALLFGAEFDSETERGRQLQAGMKSEETLQLPPKDSSRSEKRKRREEASIAAGQALRERFSSDDRRQ
jgi:membrane protein